MKDIFSSFSEVCTKLQHNLPYIFLMYAVSMMVITAWITPPYQVPDESNHFARAEQVSRGQLLAVFRTEGKKEPRTIPDERVLMPDIGGYTVDNGIQKTASYYDNIPFHPDVKVRLTQIESSKKVMWNEGPLTYGSFPNTAIYPPTGYLIVAAGIAIGKAVDASVISTLYLSRWLNGFACALICFYALRLARNSRILLFIVLLFPLTISLFGSVSQDGVLISLATLFVAIIDNVENSEPRIYTRWQMIALVFIITSISAAKPPYFLLSPVLFFISLNRKAKIVCFLIPLVLVTTWGLLNIRNYGVVWAPPYMRINAKLQIRHILAHPFQFAGYFFNWNKEVLIQHVKGFIGILGWVDMWLPSYFYRLAYIASLSAFLSTISLNLKRGLRLRLALLVLTIGCFVAVITAQYVTWVALETPYLGGVQPRYFIPVFPFLALALTGFRNDFLLKKWQLPFFLCVIIFPFITEIILIKQLIVRYYLFQ